MKLHEYLLIILIDYSKGYIQEVGVCRTDERNLVDKYIKTYSSAYVNNIFPTRRGEGISMEINKMPSHMFIYETSQDKVKKLVQYIHVIEFKHHEVFETRFKERITFMDYSDYDFNDY